MEEFERTVAKRATHLAVHVIEKSQKDLAELVGSESGDDVDNFAEIGWSEGPFGVPIVDELPGWFVGRILERVDLGDHVGHVVEPVSAHAATVDNLQFGDARDIDPGHAP